VWDNGKVRHATDDNTVWHSHVMCGITRTTDTCSECVILLFNCNNGYTNAPQCYIMCIACLVYFGPKHCSNSRDITA